MKIVSFVSALLLTAVSYAQPTVKVEEITRTIIDKGLEIVDPGLYQGSCMFHALADYALASGDSLIMEKADSVAGRFAQGEIVMKGTCNFHSYRCGGSAVAALALAGKDGYAEIVRDHASWQWKNQRRTQSDGLMTGQYTRPAQPDIFFPGKLPEACRNLLPKVNPNRVGIPKTSVLHNVLLFCISGRRSFLYR